MFWRSLLGSCSWNLPSSITCAWPAALQGPIAIAGNQLPYTHTSTTVPLLTRSVAIMGAASGAGRTSCLGTQAHCPCRQWCCYVRCAPGASYDCMDGDYVWWYV
jgi:hypothetical protein